MRSSLGSWGCLAQKRRLQGILPVNKYTKRGCSAAVAGLFFQVASNGTRGNGRELYQGRFRLNIGKHFFTEGVVRYWNRLPRKVQEAPFLEMFKRHVGVTLRVMV